MAEINKNELSKELIAKAMQCETPEELIELDSEELKAVASGWPKWI